MGILNLIRSLFCFSDIVFYLHEKYNTNVRVPVVGLSNLHNVFVKHAKGCHISIPIIVVASTLLYYYIIGKFVHYVHVIFYDRYSNLLWSICLNIHG